MARCSVRRGRDARRPAATVRAARIGLATCCAAALAAQEPDPVPPDPDATAAAAAFQQLPEGDRQRILAELERRILLDPDPLLQSIVSCARTFESYPPAEPAPFHDPATWAPGVAPARTLVRAGTPEHAHVQQGLARVPFLGDLHRAVWYEWGSGRIVRSAEPLSDQQVFENLLRGYAPGSDAAVAHVLQLLDTGAKQRALAAYLDHLYGDLDARVYEGITLYDAWYSGKVVDVPDVDAVPFAVHILKTKAYHSPIPAGARRTKLYQRIRDHTFEFRKYRTLREAAAAAFVSAAPEFDPTYRDLLPRFHFLYAAADNDPAPVAAKLRATPDRDAFLRQADQSVESDPAAFEQREARIAALRAMAHRLRALAVEALPK